ncbi:MAG: NAD-dependent epimerase/dehydratase family protein [Candidatus Omnitrophota bacterium]
MNTVLIIGGAGFIGGYLKRCILNAGDKVIVFDNFMARSLILSDFYDRYNQDRLFNNNSKNIIVKGDIRDDCLLRDVIWKYQPDFIIHLAAVSDPNIALRLPGECRSINVEGLNNVFIAMEKVPKIRKFIFVSSSYVYGDFEYEPADEFHPLKPKHIYGITKAEGERMTCRFCKENNIDYTIIRPTAVYGVGSSLERVCCKMIIDALTKKELIIHNSGDQRLDFTHIDDLIAGFMKIIYSDHAKNQIFNISRGRARSIGELADLIRSRIPQTQIISQIQKHKKPARGALDISKARSLLNFNPCIDIEEGILDLIDDLIKIKDNNDLFIPTLH